ncbi:Hypothetical protein CINCED_3A006357 [Cinara cedri]|uniref:Uncharacterized protein n=1 Tax=Cinara cedri TaxID=506608 RepID=A0A5E4N0Y3_9HEMI|nr:Hypothetical protein CINCED_3A006357 [Cinara cedri]
MDYFNNIFTLFRKLLLPYSWPENGTPVADVLSNMNAFGPLKRFPSVDSLSVWTPSRTARTEYAMRQMTLAGLTTEKPRENVDRTLLEESFKLMRACQLKVINDKLQKAGKCKKPLPGYKKIIDKEFKKLYKEYLALETESAWTMRFGTGDQSLWCRVQDHLNKITQFFYQHIEHVNSASCDWSPQYKTMIMEHLKTLFDKFTSSMDEWINMVDCSK